MTSAAWAALLGAAGCATGAAAEVIVVNRAGVGPIRAHTAASEATLEKMLAGHDVIAGVPDEMDGLPGDVVLEVRRRGRLVMTVHADDSGRVRQIDVRDSAATTPLGLKIGQPFREMQALIPDPACASDDVGGRIAFLCATDAEPEVVYVFEGGSSELYTNRDLDEGRPPATATLVEVRWLRPVGDVPEPRQLFPD